MVHKQTKSSKKGIKKRFIDPLSRKEWFHLKAPVPFKTEPFGYTCANKSVGLKKAEDAIKGRVVTCHQVDLSLRSNYHLWRKVKLIVDDIVGKEARTSFYGLDTTRDDLCFLVKKWRTMIEAVCDVKTVDGYILRIFTIAFTKKVQKQKRHTAYAQCSQVKRIRRKIIEIINKEVSHSDITQVIKAFTCQIVHEKIYRQVRNIYPVENVTVRKVKVMYRPNIDAIKLNEMYSFQRQDRVIVRQPIVEQPLAIPLYFPPLRMKQHRVDIQPVYKLETKAPNLFNV